MIKVFDATNKKPQTVMGVYFRLAHTVGDLTITAVYKGAEQIWNLIKSCFGSGKWINNSNWINSETWKN